VETAKVSAVSVLRLASVLSQVAMSARLPSDSRPDQSASVVMSARSVRVCAVIRPLRSYVRVIRPAVS
jgi:hypothetical protein